jgi:hypothetical protein
MIDKLRVAAVTQRSEADGSSWKAPLWNTLASKTRNKLLNLKLLTRMFLNGTHVPVRITVALWPRVGMVSGIVRLPH